MIKQELVTLLDDQLTADAVQVDVDLFDGREPLVHGRWLDSMDLVELLTALEERFDVTLATVLTGDDPMTLTNIAGYVARSLPS